MSRIRRSVSVLEAVYYTMGPEIIRLFMIQGALQSVAAQAKLIQGKQWYCITADADLHTYCVWFQSGDICLRRERKPGIKHSRYFTETRLVSYSDPNCIDHSLNIIKNWLQSHRRYYNRTNNA